MASGTALCIGFLTTPAAWLVIAQLITFSFLMLVVLVAGIPIEDCGCFGNLGIQETPLQVLIRDLVLLVILASVLARRHGRLEHRCVGLQVGLATAWASADVSLRHTRRRKIQSFSDGSGHVRTNSLSGRPVFLRPTYIGVD